MARRLGLMIGINNCQDPAFRPLQFAETDARALAQWLVNDRGGKWLPSDVQLLLGDEATHELAESLLMQVCVNEAKPGDLVLIYFAGHAFIDETGGDGYLAFANTSYRQPSTGLHLLSLVQKALVRSPATQIVFVLDCFLDGPTWRWQRNAPFDYRPLLGQRLLNGMQHTQGRLLYCTCRGSESAAETGGKNLGLFVHSAILGLCGPAVDSATGQVTLQNLHAFLTSTLDEQHRPKVFGQEQRPIVLVGEMPPPEHVQRNEYTLASFQPASSQSVSKALKNSPTGQLAHDSKVAATVTAQMSPTTSGELPVSVIERNRQQQCTMLVNQARQLVQMQNFSEAFNVVERVLSMAPKFIDALVLKGQILGASGRFEEALTVIEEVTQLDPDHALAWSIQAALLTNMEHPQEALPAIERSISLDPNNPESYIIRDTILANLARVQSASQGRKYAANASARKRESALSFFASAGLQLFAFILGTIGTSLLTVKPQLPIIIAFVLESLALAVLCVNAARGSYLYGFTRLLSTLVICLMAVALTGAIYKFGYHTLINRIEANPPLIVSVLFLGIWLAAAAVLPLLFALGGFIGGLVAGVRRGG